MRNAECGKDQHLAICIFAYVIFKILAHCPSSSPPPLLFSPRQRSQPSALSSKPRKMRKRRQNFITENWKPCTLDLSPCGMRNTEKIEVRPSLNSFLQIISTFIYPFPPFISFCWLQTTFNFPDFKSIWNVQYFKSIWNVQHFKYVWNVQHFKSIWNVQHFKSMWNIQRFNFFLKCPKS